MMCLSRLVSDGLWLKTLPFEPPSHTTIMIMNFLPCCMAISNYALKASFGGKAVVRINSTWRRLSFISMEQPAKILRIAR